MTQQSVEKWMNKFLKTQGRTFKQSLLNKRLEAAAQQSQPRKTLTDVFSLLKPKSAPQKNGKRHGYEIDRPTKEQYDFTLYVNDQVRQKESRNAKGDLTCVTTTDKTGHRVTITYKEGQDGHTYPAEIINEQVLPGHIDGRSEEMIVQDGLQTTLNEDGSISGQKYIRNGQDEPMPELVPDALKQAMSFYTKTVDEALAELHAGPNGPQDAPPPNSNANSLPPVRTICPSARMCT